MTAPTAIGFDMGATSTKTGVVKDGKIIFVGKVRQLEELHPHLREKPTPASPTATFSIEQLELGTVVGV